jgi:hypothetical protein
MRAVAHYNVLALAHHSEASLFERLHGREWEYTVRGRQWMD